MPEMTAQRSRTSLKAVAGRIRASWPSRTEYQVVLIDSHISVLTVSRARRADSRVPSIAAAIEQAEALS